MKPADLRIAAHGIGHWLLDLAFPPACPSCRAAVETHGNFCADCFTALRQISDPQCACCGIPFPVSVGRGALCAECLAVPPHYDTVRAPLVYDATSAPLVRSLKFHDQYGGVPRYVQMMLSCLPPGLAFDAVVPVPLHWRRLVGRRYNQSALLAFVLARRLAVPCLPQALRRTRHTQPQMHLPRRERARNVRRAFALNPACAGAITGKTLLLVDDVVTTGATVNACAEVLKKAGADRVHVVALARTVKEGT